MARAVVHAGGTPAVLDRVPPGAGADQELVDLSARRQTEAAVARVLARHPELRGVVNAAGTDPCGRLDDVPADGLETGDPGEPA